MDALDTCMWLLKHSSLVHLLTGKSKRQRKAENEFEYDHQNFIATIYCSLAPNSLDHE